MTNTNRAVAVVAVDASMGLKVQDKAAARISTAFADAKRSMEMGLRKVLSCGLMMLEQKSELPHGQFGPWLEKNCPEIKVRTAQQWMQTAESALCIASGTKSFSQMRNDCRFENGDDEILFHQIIDLPAAELPQEAAALQGKLFELVDGKSQKQLLLEFKNTEPVTGKYNPPVRSKQELADAEVADANGLLQDYRTMLNNVNQKVLALADKKVRQTFLDTLVYVSGAVRQSLTSKAEKAERDLVSTGLLKPLGSQKCYWCGGLITDRKPGVDDGNGKVIHADCLESFNTQAKRETRPGNLHSKCAYCMEDFTDEHPAVATTQPNLFVHASCEADYNQEPD